MSGSRKSGGSFRERITDNITDIAPADFDNPWNFYLFQQTDEEVYFWCRKNGILATSFPCHVENCTVEMTLANLSRAPGGVIFRCNCNRLHTKSSRAYSFFDKSNLVLQDIILFIKSYLEKNSLAICARFSGMAYKSTAVNWACFMKEVFKEYFHNTLRNVKFQGIVEIDESLFGRRVKYHKGNQNRGLKVSFTFFIFISFACTYFPLIYCTHSKFNNIYSEVLLINDLNFI